MPQAFLFIDESGNPNFYANRKRPLWTEPDFEPVLMLGMVVTSDRRALREKILQFQQEILSDVLFNTIYSLRQPSWFLHASKDHFEVRLKFIEFIRRLDDVKMFVVIGRKIPEIFHSKHNGNASEFYFDVVNKLLERFDFQPETSYSLYLSERQSNTLPRFEQALKKALAVQSKSHDTSRFMCRITPSADFPELSVVDYLLWVLKRAITKQEDLRYFKAVEDQFVEIYDIYGNDGKGQIYNADNPFDPFRIGGFGIK